MTTENTVTLTLEVLDADDRVISTRQVRVTDDPDRAWADIVDDACERIADRIAREGGGTVNVREA